MKQMLSGGLRIALALTAIGLPGALSSSRLHAQRGASSQGAIPVRELSAPTVAVPTFSNILNVRHIAGGQVLVNDAIRRRLLVLDNKLAGARVVLDSVTLKPGEGYGPTASAIVPLLPDYTFFVDRASSALLVIDPNGKVTRSSAVPLPPGAFSWLTASASSVDAAGNLLLRAVTGTRPRVIGDSSSGTVTEESRQPDSTYILRANFESRRVDTVAWLKQAGGMRSVRKRPANERGTSMLMMVSPIESLDDWATLADGTLAVARGGDYHVDFLRPDGKWESTEKLPFDWKPMTDADKQRIVDSTRAFIDGAVAKAGAAGGPAAALNAQRDAMIGNLMTLPGSVPALPPPTQPLPSGTKIPLMPYEFVPLAEMPSYYPPLRMGYTKGDADGNLLILPTTSAQSRAGELVYGDVAFVHPWAYLSRL